MLPFAWIEVGSPPQRRCHLCAPVQTRPTWRSESDLVAEIREVVAEWTAAVAPGVVFAGPDPFRHPALPALVAAARSEGCARIGIQTDGIALARGDNAAGALHAGVRHLVVDVWGLGETGDRMAGQAGAGEAALAGVMTFVQTAAARRIPVAVTVRVPVCAHNVRDLPELVAEAAMAGAGCVRLAGTGSSPALLPELVGAACDTGVVNRIWVEVAGLPLPESHWFHVVHDGRLT